MRSEYGQYAGAGRTGPPPKKSLGQHFLKDPGIAGRIVDLAAIGPEDQILEIGPGPGALTGIVRSLTWKRLLLLEKDDYYASFHQGLDTPGQEVAHLDALLFPWGGLEGPWKILGNLPYNVASPLMWDIVSQVPCLSRAVFMIQKEVADRILATPGSKTYGGLSVWIQSFATVRRGFHVPPGAFSPPPRVDSSVIVISPLVCGDRPQNWQALGKTIKMCFGRRRKQLSTILRQALPASDGTNILEELGIDPRARPEALTPGQFQQLAAQLTPLLAEKRTSTPYED